jgi:HEAT repeat protein
MHTPRGFISRTLLPVLVGALLIGCGSKDETAAKKVDVAAQVSQLKGNSDAKAGALTELAAGGPNSAGAVNDIIPLLKDDDHVVRRLAAYALCQIGPAAKAALPALKELMNDPDTSTGTTALNAINAIDPANAGAVKVLNVTR